GWVLRRKFVLPCAAHLGELRDRLSEEPARKAADPVLVGFGGDVLDRRLAVDPRQQQSRQQSRGAALETSRILPRGELQITLGQAREAGKKAVRRRAVPHAFEQQMIEAEGEIECG